MKANKLFTGTGKGMPMAKRGKDANRLFLVFLFIAMIFCNGSSLCAADGAGSNENRFVDRCVSDGLMLFNEMVSESGKNFVKAREVHSELFHVCLEAHKANYVKGELATGLLDEYESLDKDLSMPLPEGLDDPNAWAEDNIEKASKKLGEIISSFEPHLENTFEQDTPDNLDAKCEDSLWVALNGVRMELREFIKLLMAEESDNSVILGKAEDLCEANRRAIVLSFLHRFVDFESQREKSQPSDKQVDLKMFRQFQGDINRTIYWNGILSKRLKDNDQTSARRLMKYSDSELRRLKVLRAVLNKNMKEAQSLLLVEFKISYPLKAIPSQK